MIPFIIISVLTGLTCISFLIIYHLFSKQKITQSELDSQKEKIINLEYRQQLLALDYLIHGQEGERIRIAKDLHVGLSSIISTAQLQLSTIVTEIHKLENLKLYQNVEKLVDNASHEVRRIALDSLPDVLINFGLRAAVEGLAEQINQSNLVYVKTEFYLTDTVLDETYKVMLFRIIQEIFDNSMKHAEASVIQILMSINNTQQLHLTVQDDGIGFDPTTQCSTNGVGIKNIRSRVKYLNGEFHIESSTGNGTCYDIIIPL